MPLPRVRIRVPGVELVNDTRSLFDAVGNSPTRRECPSLVTGLTSSAFFSFLRFSILEFSWRRRRHSCLHMEQLSFTRSIWGIALFSLSLSLDDALIISFFFSFSFSCFAIFRVKRGRPPRRDVLYARIAFSFLCEIGLLHALRNFACYS